MGRLLALAVALGTLLIAGDVDARPRPEPRTVALSAKWIDGAVAGLPEQCREPVATQLRGGVWRRGACDAQRWAATRVLGRMAPRTHAFGVVDTRRAHLGGVVIVLSRADRCRHWPLRSEAQGVLELPDVKAAGCRVRRHHGDVTISVLDADGQRQDKVMVLRTDADGRADLRFAGLDRALRARGLGPLDGFVRVEVGRDGWAGVIDLERLGRFVADWHFEWVRLGRGSPALFDHLHPDHVRAPDARALAVEANLARQKRDYLAVARGGLRPRTFLLRYPWSPYLRSVISMVRGEVTDDTGSAATGSSP